MKQKRIIIFIFTFTFLSAWLSQVHGETLFQETARTLNNQSNPANYFRVLSADSVRAGKEKTFHTLAPLINSNGNLDYLSLYPGYHAFSLPLRDGKYPKNIVLAFYYAPDNFKSEKLPRLRFQVADTSNKKSALLRTYYYRDNKLLKYSRHGAARTIAGKRIWEVWLPTFEERPGYSWYVRVAACDKKKELKLYRLPATAVKNKVSKKLSPDKFSTEIKGEGITGSCVLTSLDKSTVLANIKVTNTSPETKFIQLTFACPVDEKNFKWFDGYNLNPQTIKREKLDTHLFQQGPLAMLPISAVYTNNAGKALAIVPELAESYLRSELFKRNKEIFQGFTLRWVLAANESRQVKFNYFSFYPRTGYRAAIDRYWQLNPEYSKVSPQVDQRLTNCGAAWAYWYYVEKDKSYLDLSRRFKATWEWCYNPCIRAGDWSITERFTKPFLEQNKGFYMKVPLKRPLTGKSYPALIELRRNQMARAYQADVVPAWYSEPYHAEVSLIRENFKDSEHLNKFNSYADLLNEKTSEVFGAPSVIVFPWNNSFGKFYAASLDRISKVFSPGAMALDSLFGNQKHYGKLDNLSYSSFDDDLDVYAYNGAGMERLCDYIKNLKNRQNQAVGIVGNIKICSPYYTQWHVTHGVWETSPIRQEDVKRQNLYLKLRFMMGQKPVTFWAPVWCAKRKQPKLLSLIAEMRKGKATSEQLRRYLYEMQNRSLVYAYYFGAYLAPNTFSGAPRLFKAMNSLRDFNKRFWRCDPGMVAPAKALLLSSAGFSENRQYAVGNLLNNVVRSRIEFIPDKHGFVPIAGLARGKLKQTFDSKGTVLKYYSFKPETTTLFNSAVILKGSGEAEVATEVNNSSNYACVIRLKITSPLAILKSFYLPENFYLDKFIINSKTFNKIKELKLPEGDYLIKIEGKTRFPIKTSKLKHFDFAQCRIFTSKQNVNLAEKIVNFFHFYYKHVKKVKKVILPEIIINNEAKNFIAISRVKSPVQFCPSSLSPKTSGQVELKGQTLYVSDDNLKNLQKMTFIFLEHLDTEFLFEGFLGNESGFNYLNDRVNYLPEIKKLLTNNKLED